MSASPQREVGGRHKTHVRASAWHAIFTKVLPVALKLRQFFDNCIQVVGIKTATKC
jgi:hypothetical protein